MPIFWVRNGRDDLLCALVASDEVVHLLNLILHTLGERCGGGEMERDPTDETNVGLDFQSDIGYYAVSGMK